MSGNARSLQFPREEAVVDPDLLSLSADLIIGLRRMNIIVAVLCSGHLDRHTTRSSVVLKPTCALTISCLQLRLSICLCRHSIYYNHCRIKGNFLDSERRLVELSRGPLVNLELIRIYVCHICQILSYLEED